MKTAFITSSATQRLLVCRLADSRRKKRLAFNA